MERPKDLSITTAHGHRCYYPVPLVGLVGLLVPFTQPLFLQIVPWHILLMLLVIVLAHKNFDEKFRRLWRCCLSAGIVLEWIGVHKTMAVRQLCLRQNNGT
jgi:putative membrane protein